MPAGLPLNHIIASRRSIVKETIWSEFRKEVKAMQREQSEVVQLRPRKLLLSIREVSEMISLSESKCRELAHAGEFEAIHIGASLRIVAQSLEEWISLQERVA
jgi:excisionase family DNA binding protein